MKIADVMQTEVEFVAPEAPVWEAAVLMADLNAGAVPVGTPDDLQGIITDRDILIRVVAQQKDNMTTPTREVMSSWVYVCALEDRVEDVVEEMHRREIRRMPVINRERRVVGIVSLDELQPAVERGSSSASEPERWTVRPKRANAVGRLLLVEDDKDIRDVLAAMLAEGGYEVTEAGTRAEAQDRLRERIFSLLVTDVGLPDGSGADLARAVAAAGTPSLVITGNGNEAQRLELHGQPYLVKPFRAVDLLAAVSRRLSARQPSGSNQNGAAPMEQATSQTPPARRSWLSSIGRS
jgi:CBS domain-containing protein/CheY-like chemotaxis protein